MAHGGATRARASAPVSLDTTPASINLPTGRVQEPGNQLAPTNPPVETVLARPFAFHPLKRKTLGWSLAGCMMATTQLSLLNCIAA
jgi:hypothetical protein